LVRGGAGAPRKSRELGKEDSAIYCNKVTTLGLCICFYEWTHGDVFGKCRQPSTYLPARACAFANQPASLAVALAAPFVAVERPVATLLLTS